MRIIGLDTSSQTGGAALIEGTRLIGEYTLSLQRMTHSEQLLPTLGRVLDDAGVPSAPEPPAAGIAVVLGPGSFTGLRIGVVTAKTLGYAWNVPVVGVSTLAALAYQAQGAAPVVCSLMDARHGNVYTAAYDVRRGKLPAEGESGVEPRPVIEPALQDAAAFFATIGERLDAAGFAGESITFVGDGLFQYEDTVRAELGGRAVIAPSGFQQLRAGAVAMLGRMRFARGDADDAMQLAPLYLRKSEAERKWEARANNR